MGNIVPISGINKIKDPSASYGKMNEVSSGKDSISGHWEIGGLFIDSKFPVYPDGFPESLLNSFYQLTGLNGCLGNIAASGTEIINQFGDEHLRTGFPIIYTSADSVFQIAAHENVIPLKKLYEICEISRNSILINEHSVGRVIARPFLGSNGNYTRTSNRRDFSLNPPEPTILDYLSEFGINTIGIGKVNDLFNDRGIKIGIHTKSNSEGITQILESMKKFENSFIFANLVDFDVYYGHRNDTKGFYQALKEFDSKLPRILKSMSPDDALIITADHGNDPTTPSTDHSREYVPVLFYYSKRKPGSLGIRNTFSDVAQTVAHFYKVNNDLNGVSFLHG